MKALVVAPHPDDEALGCGGTIRLHGRRGDHVTAVFLTSGELGLKHLSLPEAWRIREEEARNAGKILALADLRFLRCPDWQLNENISSTARLLQEVIDREQPERIYFPHPQDSHPDHQATAPILATALNIGGKTPAQLYAYEVWTPLSAYDHAEDISAVMAHKLRAVRCHRSQLSVFHYDRAVQGLNRYRGCLAARCRYAEVFQQFQFDEFLENHALGQYVRRTT
jgi:LmbE family N-acetylglucosaminyl deacetylase